MNSNDGILRLRWCFWVTRPTLVGLIFYWIFDKIHSFLCHCNTVELIDAFGMRERKNIVNWQQTLEECDKRVCVRFGLVVCFFTGMLAFGLQGGIELHLVHYLKYSTVVYFEFFYSKITTTSVNIRIDIILYYQIQRVVLYVSYHVV